MIVTITDMEKTKTKYASRWGNITITKKKKNKKKLIQFQIVKMQFIDFKMAAAKWRFEMAATIQDGRLTYIK